MVADTRVFSIGSHGRIEGYLGRDGRLVAHGELSLSYPDGRPAFKGAFVHGKAEGRWYRWYDNGAKMSRHGYVGGKPHGEFVQWYRGGAVAREGRFADGHAADRHRVYYDDSRQILAAETSYRKGRRVDQMREWTRGGAERWIGVEDGHVGGFAVDPYAQRVCILVSPGNAISASIEEMIAALSQSLSPSQVELLLQGINRLYEQHGLDPGNRVLLKCPGGFTSLPASPATPGAAGSGTPDVGAMVEACRDHSVGALSAAGIGDPEMLSAGDWHTWVDAQVDRLDEVFGDCRDRVNPTVVDGGGAASDNEPSMLDEVATWLTELAKTGATQAKEAGEAVAMVVAEAIENPDKAAAAVALVVGYYVVSAEMSDLEDPQDRADQAIAMDALGQAIKGMALGLLTEKLDEDATGPVQGGSAPPRGVGGDLPEGGGAMSCADLQDGWSTLKAMCDAADWKTLDCLAFLGVSTRCLELVMPTPDGGYVCRGGTAQSLDAEDMARELRRRICEMTAGLFVDNHCVQGEGLVPAPVYQPCQDPRALWGPDQCIGAIAASLRQVDTATTAPPLGVAGTIARLDDDGFEEAVNSADRPTLVVFVASHCGPCRRVLDTLADASDEYAERVRFRSVDITRNPLLAERYGVRYTPTMLMFRAGAVVGERRVGAAPAHRILRFVDRSLGIARNGLPAA